MSYLVLARKYRPRSFSEMVGQEHVVQALSNALTQQRLHHAYLFTGTRGVGKTTVSRILAKSLNCQGPDGQGGITATPCGRCQACTDIDAGRFVDYTELDAASNRGVDEVQGLLEQAVYKPVQGRFKVFMIDEVHMLTNTAFNAMLKTLEEPPEYLKFVLATTDPQKVPVTVLSRCLQFNLRPMAPETVLEHLTRVLGAEQVPAEPGALRLLARAARGSMRDALSLTDQAIAYGNGELTEGGVRQMLGSADRGHVHALIDALARGDGQTVVETSEAMRRDGLSAASTLEEMTAVLQAMAVLQAVPARAQAAQQDETVPDAMETARLAAALPRDETQLLYSLCLHGRAELGLAPDEYAALTMVLLRLLAFKPAEAVTPPAEKKSLLTAQDARPASTPAPDARPLPLPATPVAPEARAPEAPMPSASPASVTLAEPAPQEAATPPWEDAAAAMDAAARPASGPEPQAGAAHAPAVQAAPSQAPSPAAAGPERAARGQRLPVVDAARRAAPPETPRQAREAPSEGTELSPIPLRVQPPPGARERPSDSRLDPIPPSEEGDFWFATVTALVAAEAITALARELALQSQLVARDVDQWLLRVERESLNQGASREKLQNALAGAGHAVRLVIEIGAVTDSPARRNRLAAEARQRAAEEAIRNDPDVQLLMQQWGARIVPGSLKPA
ncbi:DNA polymerase III subunit gamma/tau [Xenophilus sp. Marseille-Q4582]|uniref:DNA polymerase III subunit gamma/tau n=1 Tax=Xenophilus sp. Marseille-Q4582 TaxID=2866600 RepID=UPI001CE47BBB|nr:DNA polymerase III subunit gamma/tau [Xenophilus sp. Marseille-Q4582]